MVVYNVLSNHNKHYVEKKYPRDKDIMVVGSEATEKYDTMLVKKSIVSEKIFKQGKQRVQRFEDGGVLGLIGEYGPCCQRLE